MVRLRLYRHRILQENIHVATFFREPQNHPANFSDFGKRFHVATLANEFMLRQIICLPGPFDSLSLLILSEFGLRRRLGLTILLRKQGIVYKQAPKEVLTDFAKRFRAISTLT